MFPTFSLKWSQKCVNRDMSQNLKKLCSFLVKMFPRFPEHSPILDRQDCNFFQLCSYTLVDRVGASLGLYSSYRGGRGGHPLTVPQYTKDHLKSIISLPPDWPGNDTTQMILDVLAHHQRVSSSPVRADEM